MDGTTAIIAAAAAALGSILSMVGKFVIDLFTIKNKSDERAMQSHFRDDLNQQIENLRKQVVELHDQNMKYAVENAELLAKLAALEMKVVEFEEGLRVRQARGILETAVDAIVTIDEKGIVDSFNPAAVHMFGYLSEEIIGQNVNLLMPEPDAQRHSEFISRYVRTGEGKIIGIGRRVTAKRKDGSLFVIDLAISELRIDGTRHFTGVARYVREGALDDATTSTDAAMRNR